MKLPLPSMQHNYVSKLFTEADRMKSTQFLYSVQGFNPISRNARVACSMNCTTSQRDSCSTSADSHNSPSPSPVPSPVPSSPPSLPPSLPLPPPLPQIRPMFCFPLADEMAACGTTPGNLAVFADQLREKSPRRVIPTARNRFQWRKKRQKNGVELIASSAR